MQALVKRWPKSGLNLEDVPKPIIKDSEVLIKIRKTAICGSDLHLYDYDDWAKAHISLPLTIGHEYMGTIEELGPLVKGLKIGQRVSGEGHIVCGFCRNCLAGKRHLCLDTKGIGFDLPGAYAQFMALPASNVFPVPDDISDDEAAIMDPLGNAVHTALSFDLPGEDVLITGAGPIGIMAGIICLKIGARNVVITDINPKRLKLAQKLGLKHCIDVSKVDLSRIMKQLDMREGFDRCLEMSGSPLALNNILENIRPGGKVALLGLLPENTQISFDKIIFKALEIKGIYGREIFETWYKMKTLLQSGLNIKGIITDHFEYDQFEKAFKVMKGQNGGKVILNW